jgi:hypothetical protein
VVVVVVVAGATSVSAQDVKRKEAVVASARKRNVFFI